MATAKLTYLQMINKIMRLITQADITDVTTATGQALIISDLINQAQNDLFNQDDWYSLYTTTTWATVASTAEYAAFGSTDGRTIDLIDTTNDLILTEDTMRSIDSADPDSTTTGNPLYFTLANASYKLYPIPNGVYTIRERYWKSPTPLSANSSQSILPIEVENCILAYAERGINEYLNNYDKADRASVRYNKYLEDAKRVNKKKIDRLLKSGRGTGRVEGLNTISPPRMGSHYPRIWR